MISALLLVLVILLVAALGVTVLSVRQVRPGTEAVTERLGAYHRTLAPGLHLVLPGDKLRRVGLEEQNLRLAAQPLISEDDVAMTADADVAYRVVDARAATYEIADHRRALQQLTLTVLRNLAGAMDAEALLVSSGHVTEQLREVLAEALPTWGIEAGRIDVRLERAQPR